MRSQHHLWVMRLVACALLSGCSARVEDTLNLLNTCPNGPDACLEMDLGLANPADERLIGQELLPGGRVVIDIMRGEFTQPYQGYDIFTSWQRRTLIKYSLTIDAQQNLFFGSGDQCVALKDDDRFKRVEPENCAPTAYRPTSRGVIQRVQEIGAVKDPHYAKRLQYDLLEPDGLPFYIYEYGVACT